MSTFKVIAGNRNGWKCCWCNRPLRPMAHKGHRALDEPYDDGTWPATLEHLCPRSQGGTNAPENLALACPACNNDRHNVADPEKWGHPPYHRITEELGKGWATLAWEEDPTRWDEPLPTESSTGFIRCSKDEAREVIKKMSEEDKPVGFASIWPTDLAGLKEPQP